MEILKEMEVIEVVKIAEMIKIVIIIEIIVIIKTIKILKNCRKVIENVENERRAWTLGPVPYYSSIPSSPLPC